MVIRVVAIIIFLLGLAVGGYVIWQDRQDQKQPRLLERAQQAYQEGENDLMVMLIEEAVALDSDNVEAHIAAAKLLEAVGDPRVVMNYGSIAFLSPEDYQAFMDWMLAVEKYESPRSAYNAYLNYEQQGFGKLEQGATLARFGATLALKVEDFPAALAYLRRAVELEPENQRYALDLAELEAEVLPVAELAPTVTRLQELIEDEQLRSEAAIALLGLYERTGNESGLRETAVQLWKYGEYDLSSRLHALDALYEVDREAYAAKLALLLEEQERRPVALARILSWLNEHGEYDAVVAAATAPDARLHFKRPPLSPLVAEAMVHANELNALAEYYPQADWTGEEGFGFLLYPLTETRNRERQATFPNPRLNRWLRSARPDDLRELLEAARRMDFVQEQEWILENIIEREPWEREAYDELIALLSAKKASVAEYKVLARARQNFPRDRELANEYAYLSLVLDMGRLEAVEISEDNFNHDPDNRDYRDTQAMALCMLRRPAKAIDLLYGYEPLSPRGMVTKALAHRMLAESEAQKELIMQLDPEVMLPEEWKLVLGSQQYVPTMAIERKLAKPAENKARIQDRMQRSTEETDK